MPVLKRYKKVLPCALKPEELEARGEDLAKLCQEIETAEEAKRQAAATHKLKIDAMEENRAKLARVVRQKSEEREIECEEILVIDDGLVKIMRLDTNEEVDRRPASSGELNTIAPGLFDQPAQEVPPPPGSGDDSEAGPSSPEDLEKRDDTEGPQIGPDSEQ